MRTIEVPLSKILNLVECAVSYGFTNTILLDSLLDMVETLTDDEIVEYARITYLTQDARSAGYTDEDYDSAITVLKDWRNKIYG